MNFHTFGDKNYPRIMLIHGGGNAWWNYLRQARALSEKYHVILPTLDGHGEEYLNDLISTEDEASKLIDYIHENYEGELFALCGVSYGGQIVLDMLSIEPNLAKKVIVESSLCYPTPITGKFSITMIKLFGNFLFSEKACKRQLAAMPKMLPSKMLYPEELQKLYLQDIPRICRETLYRMYELNMNYTLKPSLQDCTAKVMYWYGEKELKSVKKSAQLLKNHLKSCEIYEAKGYNHGYLAIYLPEEWLELAKDFFERP